MAAPPKPWKAEYAKSGRSSCKSCKSPINKEQLRLGKMVTATMFDGFMPLWNHAGCVFKKKAQIKSVDDVEGIETLRWEDQQRLRKYVEGETSAETKAADNEYAIEVSQTARATCKHCSQKIMKGMIRVSSKPEGQGSRGLAWYHSNCFKEMSPSTNLETITGWDSLSSEDKLSLSGNLKKDPSANKTESTTSKGSKRKTIENDGRKSKAPKTDQSNMDGVMSANGRNAESVNSSSVASNLEKELESQSKALWNIKDELKKHVTTGELREMLEANGLHSTGSEYDLRDRCADGMLFGPLDSCPLCSSSLQYSGGQYRCCGYVSAWSKCSYSTVEPARLKEKWKIPDETSNEYLKKWFKSQKLKKPVRILPPLSPNKPLSSQATVRSPLSSEGKLEDIKFSLGGELTESVEDLKKKIVSAGGKFHPKVKKDTSCLVWCGEVNNDDSEIRKSRKMKIPIVREDYLLECVQNQKKLLFDMYRIEPAPETLKAGVVTVKVKGHSAVHEASGLQDCGHILEDGKSIYNTTLNMSDLSTGINSYYILQIIQEDKGSNCYVFRKWGRVGNEKIGGNKLEELSKSEAIQEFKRLFLEKTGNPWEAWEQKHNFQKQPGRFFPLDIDYGVKELKKKKDPASTRSLLAPQLLELMKMLFDVETYRAAMMEFEINLSEMPLGKLSKNNIQKGFEALTEIQNLLHNSNYDPSMKESMIVDASNRFFTLIPSVHPHIIRDEDDFKAKVKMLEALQDIEIASRLVGFDTENDESLDEKYKKLRCDITPLPRDSDDFKLVEKYLLNTHAPTHKDWSLQVEEVFALDREGEFDKYAPYRNKLQNKMLLWHGSRLTNFVGILSQGLRIAPPEAPVTGYMFGKGVYFADLVSKSAQYCYVDKKSPVGLMLLSEVALGDIHELKKAKYMDKPPKGKHSTKGLGKTVPLESEYVKWKEEVVVPCGKPVSSSVRASELLYNEYIVYDTAQVKMQFLLKVRFNHKR